MPKKIEPHIADPKGFEAALVALASSLEKLGAAPEAALTSSRRIARSAAFSADHFSLASRELEEEELDRKKEKKETHQLELIAQRSKLDSLSKSLAKAEAVIGSLGPHGLIAFSTSIRNHNRVGPIDRAEGVIDTWARLIRDLPAITGTIKQLAELPKGATGIKYHAGAIDLCMGAARIWRDCVGVFPGKTCGANGNKLDCPMFDGLQSLLLTASGDNDVKNLLRQAEYDEAISRLILQEAATPPATDA